METEKQLSGYFGLYKRKEISKKDLEGEIFRYLINKPGRYNLFEDDEESWGDFISWVYPRISIAIDKYKETGSSFDSYLTGLLHGTAREYRAREADHKLTEYVCWQARAEEMKLFESEPEYKDHIYENPVIKFLNPRQLLFLLLKSYYYATEEMLDYVAKVNVIKKSDIQQMIDKLRAMRSHRENAIRGLQDRIHLQHYRCLAYQKRMNHSQRGSDYYFLMESRFKRAVSRHHSMKKRLSSMRKAASNRMIAQVLGIPVGTVDSGLSAIKSRLSDLKDLC